MEYLTFVPDFKNFPDGKETDIVIKSLSPGPRKYEARYVKALVSSTPDTIPDGDTLWIRTRLGYLRPKPWAIKIIEELDPRAPK
jgi:hypothetical protein